MVFGFLAVFGLHGELSIAVGSGVTLVPEEPVEVFPDIRLLLGTDIFLPLTDIWNFGMKAGGAGYFKPIDQYSRYFYSASMAFSAREDFFFFRTTLSAAGEQQYFQEFPALPDLFDNRVSAEVTFDIGDTTLAFIPSVTFQRRELVGDLFSADGKIRFTFLLAETLVCAAEVSGSMNIYSFDATYYALSPSINLSWYPAAPLVITESAGVSFEDSDYTETVLAEAVQRKDFTAVFLNSECAVSFTDSLLFTLSVPVKIKFFSYNAIQNSAFISENEWILYAGLEMDFVVIPYDHGKWLFSLMAEQLFSNSDYLSPGSVIFSVSCQWNY